MTEEDFPRMDTMGDSIDSRTAPTVAPDAPKCMACGEPMAYGSAKAEDDCPWCRDQWPGDHQHLICLCRVPYTRSWQRDGLTRRIYMVGLHSGSWNSKKPIVKWGAALQQEKP